MRLKRRRWRRSESVRHLKSPFLTRWDWNQCTQRSACEPNQSDRILKSPFLTRWDWNEDCQWKFLSLLFLLKSPFLTRWDWNGLRFPPRPESLQGLKSPFLTRWDWNRSVARFNGETMNLKIPFSHSMRLKPMRVTASRTITSFLKSPFLTRWDWNQVLLSETHSTWRLLKIPFSHSMRLKQRQCHHAWRTGWISA
jgi:hypothetical protein